MDERILPQRILLAKVGLDGHDRGIKVVARGLRDAGFHVIYSGLWQKVESVAQAAQDEDVDWLGVSILNGAHMTLVPQLLEALRECGLAHVGVIVGGIIPPADQEKLKQMGVVECFGPGASIETIAAFLSKHVEAAADMQSDIPRLVGELQRGSRAAFSRLLTLTAATHQSAVLAEAIKHITKVASPVIALTGSGGGGKSSLLGAVAAHFAERGERIGVLACDPESPLTGGALLGDRCRIAGNSDTERIFIRSLSTAAGQQGIAQNIDLMLDLMKAFAFDRIFVETVGAGQGDVAVRRVADIVVLVLQPQTGDELQWEKAGILEVADVVVVNKCDLAGADQTIADVSQQLQATGAPSIPIVKTSVARREGIEEFCRILESVSVSPIKLHDLEQE